MQSVAIMNRDRSLNSLKPRGAPRSSSTGRRWGVCLASAARFASLASLTWLALPATAVLSLTLLAAAGCSSTWGGLTGLRADDGQRLERPIGPGLVATSRPLIADVPMPVGFVALPDRSNSYMSGDGVRVVQHTYQGLGEVIDAVRFYRQHLPLNGWQTVAERSAGTVTRLDYVKGRERLSVVIGQPRVLDIEVHIRARAVRPAADTPGESASVRRP